MPRPIHMAAGMVQAVLQACLLAWAEVAIVMAEALAELSRAELRAFHAPVFALCELSLLDPVINPALVLVPPPPNGMSRPGQTEAGCSHQDEGANEPRNDTGCQTTRHRKPPSSRQGGPRWRATIERNTGGDQQVRPGSPVDKASGLAALVEGSHTRLGGEPAAPVRRTYFAASLKLAETGMVRYSCPSKAGHDLPSPHLRVRRSCRDREGITFSLARCC